MFQPNPLFVFDMFYQLISAEGREAALFGGAPDRLRTAVKKSLLNCEHIPIFYLEIPLTGEPYCDVTTFYSSSLPHGACFASGGGYGLEKTFAWWVTEPKDMNCCCGIEVDVGKGKAGHGAAILSYREKTEYIKPFLDTLGAGERLVDCLSFLEKKPRDWEQCYLGLFAKRPGAPLRIAVALSGKATEAIHAEPKRLADGLRQVGFTAFNEDMLLRCAEHIVPGIYAELQFDLQANGKMGDTLGVITSLLDLDILNKDAYMRTDRGAALFEKMERENLTDGRWRRLAGCAVSKGRRYSPAEGKRQLLGYVAGVHSVKLKYCGGSLHSSKCYLVLKAKMVEDNIAWGGAGP